MNKKEILNSVILESINESEREKEQLLNSLVEKICYLDLDYRIKWVNNAGLKSISPDISIDEIIGKPCYQVWYNRSAPCPSCPAVTTLKTGWPSQEEMEHEDGSTSMISTQAVIGDNGKLNGIIEVDLDISMRKEAERALEKGQQRLRALLNAIPDMLLVFTEGGIFLDYHPASDFDLILNGVNPDGRHLTEILPKTLATLILENCKKLFESENIRNFEYCEPETDKDKYFDCRLVRTGSSEIVCIISDISSRKSREKEFYLRSFHDSLTGLYNRAYFKEELRRIEQSRKSLPTSILVIDVNCLKLINDAFGHQFGDLLLKQVSGILSSNCRKSDVIARTGGDEFAILLPGSPLEKAEKLSRRIIKACAESPYDDIFARPSVSIGCAVKNDETDNLENIISLADERMYRMKLNNRKKHLNILITDILDTTKKRCEDSKYHTERCVRITEMFSKHANLSAGTAKKVIELALFHDIGKIRIPEEILNKQQDQLTEDEQLQMKQHPIIGYRITQAMPDYAPIAELILHHHENWNGSGYPSGLKGKEIPVASRIFSIIDRFDTLTHCRASGNPLSYEDAIMEISRESGKQFDPEFTRLFLKMFEENKDTLADELRF